MAVDLRMAPGVTMSDTPSVKPFRALTWPDADTADSLLVQQCVAGEEEACARLVRDHQRMVYQLALHLLGDSQEALDLSQEVLIGDAVGRGDTHRR